MTKWPTDERFRRIAAKIADSVTLYDGYVSASCWDGRCPMSCVNPGFPSKRPGTNVMAMYGMTDVEYVHFTASFDDGRDRGTPFSWLGLEYRKRFP